MQFTFVQVAKLDVRASALGDAAASSWSMPTGVFGITGCLPKGQASRGAFTLLVCFFDLMQLDAVDLSSQSFRVCHEGQATNGSIRFAMFTLCSRKALGRTLP